MFKCRGHGAIILLLIVVKIRTKGLFARDIVYCYV